MATTEDVESGHQDRVTVLNINFDGSKLLTASIDHRVKVWNIDRESGERSLVETFTAHDADIRDAKWLHPSTGTHLATIGNDLKCHLWQEDPYQAPNSGRRFRRIYTIPSKPRVPFVSLDFKNLDHLYTYLALIDRQGLLSIYEPTNPDEFKDWTLVDQFHVSLPPPGRGEQTCFKVRFDQNVTPLPYINCVSDARRQLGLVVTAMNEVKIYRSVKEKDSEQGSTDAESLSSNPNQATHRFMFYEAAKLPAHPSLIRDVQWAPFNVRGTDLFATACKDGGVRIFELAISENIDRHRASAQARNGNNTNDNITASHSHNNSTSSQVTNTPTSVNVIRQPQQHPQSSLTTAITNTTRNQSTTNTTTTPPGSNNPSQPTTTGSSGSSGTSGPNQNRTSHRFPYTTLITLAANLERAHDDAWSVIWDPSGQVLMSGGSDGVTKIWRKGILDLHQNGLSGSGSGDASTTDGDGSGGGSGSGGAKWMLFADQAVDFGSLRDGDGQRDDGSDLV